NHIAAWVAIGSRIRFAASLVLGVALIAHGRLASAAVGDLTFAGCIGDLVGCTATNPSGALDGAEQVAVSGSNLYVAAATANAVSHFTLDAGGNPSFVGCVGDLSGCTATSPAGALDNASSVAVGGQHLYVTGAGGISHFTLDAAGNPSFVGCTGN